MQKGRMPLFEPNFSFCRMELIFGRLTYFDMNSIVLLICASFLRNNVCKKSQFSKWHLRSESFEGGFRPDTNVNGYFAQLQQHGFFETCRCFDL